MKQSIQLALTLPGCNKEVLCEVTKKALHLLGKTSVADILFCTEKPRFVLSVEEVMGRRESAGFSTLRRKAQAISASPAFPGKWLKRKERIILLADSFLQEDDSFSRESCEFLEALTLTSSRKRILVDTVVVQEVKHCKIFDKRSFQPDELVMVYP
jgi:hypothetical protein